MRPEASSLVVFSDDTRMAVRILNAWSQVSMSVIVQDFLEYQQKLQQSPDHWLCLDGRECDPLANLQGRP